MEKSTFSPFSGKAKVLFCEKLGPDWKKLADLIEIKPSEQAKFDKGYEPRAIWEGCDLNLKQPQEEERQRDLFFAKTVSIFEPLKLMPVNLKCQPHRVVSSAYRQDKIAVL